MKTISKSQNYFRVMPLVTFFAFSLSSTIIFSGMFPANVSAEEIEAKHIAALQSSEKNNLTNKNTKNENKEQVKEEQEYESITYSLDDGSMAGAYGDGVYGR